MIGMNAVVMDGAVIGAESMVGAMSFVKAGTDVPPRSLVAGVPARVLRTLRDDEIAWKTQGTGIYQHLGVRYRETSRPVEPLTEVEPNRPRVPELSHPPKHERT